MQSSTKQNLNIVIYSCDEFSGVCIGETCWEGKFVNGVLSVESDEHKINIFLRWPKGYGFANPIGVTDVLIVHIPEDQTDITEIEAYCQARANIPVKIVISKNEQHKSWESNGFKYTSFSSDLKDFSKNGIIEYEQRLRGAFNKFDIDGTGVNRENFALIAQELGVDASTDSFSYMKDANFSLYEKMTYSKFRTWYIFGREDDNFWCYYIKNADQVEELINLRIKEISEIFEKATKENTQSNEYNGNMVIGTSTPFNFNTKFGWDLLTGDEHDSTQINAPFTLRHAPFTFSLEIGINEAFDVEQAVQILNMFKEMGIGMVPDIGKNLRLGIDLQFRVASNSSFFFDFVVSGLLGNVILENASKINFHLLKYAGFNKFHIQSELSPLFLLTKTLDDLLLNACNTEIGGEGKFVNSKTVFGIASAIFKHLGGSSKLSKNLDSVLNFLNVFKTGEFQLKFDSSLMSSAIKNFINARSSRPDKFAHYSQQFIDNQMMMNGFVEQGKQMAMFVAEYVELIKNINFDKIAFHLNFSVVRTSLHFHLLLNGLSDFINKTLLA